MAVAACCGLLMTANGEDENAPREPAFPKELVKAGAAASSELKANLEALARDKASALKALTYFRKHRFIELLVRVVEHHPIDEIRAVAAEDLADIKAYRALRALRRITEERDKHDKRLERAFGPMIPHKDKQWYAARAARTNRIGVAYIELRQSYDKARRFGDSHLTAEEEERYEAENKELLKQNKLTPTELNEAFEKRRKRWLEKMTEDQRALWERNRKIEMERLRILWSSTREDFFE